MVWCGVLALCSDSRAPPELIFNQNQGQLFIVREAGQVPNNNSIASLEFAVAVLGVKTILVLGHTECGAVAAAMSGDKLPSNALTQLASEIRLDAHPGDDLMPPFHITQKPWQMI